MSLSNFQRGWDPSERRRERQRGGAVLKCGTISPAMKAGYFRRRVSKVSAALRLLEKWVCLAREAHVKPLRQRLTRPIKQQKDILCILNILNHHSCVLSFTIFPRPTFNSKQSLILTNRAAGGRLTSLPPTFSLPAAPSCSFQRLRGEKEKSRILELVRNLVLWRLRRNFCAASGMICFFLGATLSIKSSR